MLKHHWKGTVAAMKLQFQHRMEEDIAQLEEYMKHMFSHAVRHADLYEAMNYALLAGGKRIRPVLTLETCRMCGGEVRSALPFACAIEMIHTYSLIHDDLPAMDDSPLRRGRPTTHRVYGEATAILAGDGLLTAAFEVLTCAQLPAERVVAAVQCLSVGAGPAGMVGGQVLDIRGEGRALSLEELEELQSLKTGALISAAAELGCIAAGGSAAARSCVCRYAAALGRAFQVRDDLLDVTSSQNAMGKPVGSDQRNQKSTFVTQLGVEGCVQSVEQLTKDAKDALTGFQQPEFHIWLADQLAQRDC